MKYIKLNKFVYLLLLLFTGLIQAQTENTVSIESVVYDKNGMPVSGVAISSEQNFLATTDSLGSFTLDVLAGTSLKFRKEGYKPLDVVASEDLNNIMIDFADYNQDVQVAFRNVKANDLMGGVSYVDVSELLKKSYYVNSLENMDALANGFHGNIWGNNSYLLLVDGLPRDANSVNATEIDQVSFLKGAAAVALYGSRAAKGVVMITTKRGLIGEQKIQFRTNYGVNIPKRYPRYVGSAEYMTLFNEARQNDDLDPLYSDELIYNSYLGENPFRYPNIDFYSPEYLQELYSTYDATLEISGGNDKVRYYTNLGYWREGSILDFGQASENANERINVRGNLDVKVTSFITAYADAAITFRNGNGVNTNYFEGAATIRPNEFTPLLPIDYLEADDSESQGFVNTTDYLINGNFLLGGTQLDPTNPFADIYAGGSNKTTQRQFQFNTGVNADLNGVLKGLTFKSMFGIDYTTSYVTAFNNDYATYEPTWNNYSGTDLITGLVKRGQDASSRTQNIYNNSFRQTIAASAQLNYETQVDGIHNINAMLVADGFQQSASGVYHRTSNVNMGLFLGYNYRNKYYAEFNGTVIHSARLPENERKAFSPSASIAWRLSEENFMQSASWIDDLRITAQGGIIHTDLDISDYYLYESIYRNVGDGLVYYTWKDGLVNYNTAVTRGGNPLLSFPKREEVSIGVDASLFNRSITLNANVFKSRMTGLVTTRGNQYPNYFTSGYPVSNFIPFENYNEEERTGYDFNVNFNQQLGEVNTSLGIVGTYYETKATQRDENFENSYQNRTGRPLDAIWGLENEGFYNTEEEIANGPESAFGSLKPGDIRYVDQNGDGVINAQDEVYLGRGGWYGAPFTLGVNLTAKWRNFTFFALATGRFGAIAMRNGNYFWVSGQGKYSEVVRDRWTPETMETATYPRLTTLNAANNFRNSDFWLFSTDRVDLSRVQISYDFSGPVLSKTFLDSFGIYVNGSNLLTLSKNVEILETSVGGAPQTRFFNLGLKASF